MQTRRLAHCPDKPPHFLVILGESGYGQTKPGGKVTPPARLPPRPSLAPDPSILSATAPRPGRINPLPAGLARLAFHLQAQRPRLLLSILIGDVVRGHRRRRGWFHDLLRFGL